MAKLKSYTLMVKLQADVSISVRAESLKDALDKSTTLTFDDCVPSDQNDYTLNTYGVYES